MGVGRGFGGVVQESWRAALHFPGAAIQTLIAAKGGPYLRNSDALRGVSKCRQKCGKLSRDCDWKDGRLISAGPPRNHGPRPAIYPVRLPGVGRLWSISTSSRSVCK